MDLLVWFIDQNGGSSHSLDLAKVLGDGRLLERWRKAQLATVCFCLTFVRIGKLTAIPLLQTVIHKLPCMLVVPATCTLSYAVDTLQVCFCNVGSIQLW